MSNFLNIKPGLNIKIWDIAHMGHGPYGPRPIWAKAHMGQGPYGPRAPGPRALPCWANTSPKNAPWKKESKLCFLCIFWKQKRCATSVRSFWRRYRAEISAMCQKTKVSVLRRGNVRRRRSERKFPGAKAGQKVTVRSAAFWVGKSYTVTNATPPYVQNLQSRSDDTVY